MIGRSATPRSSISQATTLFHGPLVVVFSNALTSPLSREGEPRRRLGLLEPIEHLLEILPGELPVERPRDPLTAAAEREQRSLERVEIGEVVRGQRLALDHGEAGSRPG